MPRAGSASSKKKSSSKNIPNIPLYRAINDLTGKEFIALYPKNPTLFEKKYIASRKTQLKKELLKNKTFYNIILKEVFSSLCVFRKHHSMYTGYLSDETIITMCLDFLMYKCVFEEIERMRNGKDPIPTYEEYEELFKKKHKKVSLDDLQWLWYGPNKEKKIKSRKELLDLLLHKNIKEMEDEHKKYF